MSAADLGETSSADLAATYDRGFSLLKDATLRENEHDYAEAQKLYIDGCAVFMQLKEVEKDPQKKETIRKNLSEFISAAERVSKKLESDTPQMPTDFHGETGGTGESGERATSKREKPMVEGEAQRNIAFKDTEMGEGMSNDDPEIEIIVRKSSRLRYGLLVFITLVLVSIIALIVILTRSSDSTTNEESSTMSTGWRFEIGMEISGFDVDLTVSEVEGQISPSLEIVKLELDLADSEILILEVVEEISEGTYSVFYNLYSQIEGNADIYKTYIKENRDTIEANILEAIFGSSTTTNQTIAIDDTDDGLVIVAITASPTELPTKNPSYDPASVPTASSTTSLPTNLPTYAPTASPTTSPTVVGPLYQTITWATTLCCLLESQIESTVTSVASVLSLSTERVYLESYITARRRSDSEAASTWNINYEIYTYTTDDPSLHTELINNLEDDTFVDAIGDHITSNVNATISLIQTVSLSAELNDKDWNGDILWIILYAIVGGIAFGVFCYCAYKCRRCSKN